MAIEIYRGKYVTGDSAREYIDIDTINDGCKLMKSASEKLDIIQKKIDYLKEFCSKEALYIQGESLEEKINSYEKNVNNFSGYIDDLSNTIEATALRVFNRKQVILNEDAKRLDEKIIYEKENTII